MELLQRSKSIASGGAERARLLSPIALAGMALGAGLVLALIFPKRTLVEQISLQQRGDMLTISYLVNLLRTDPHNLDLQYQLARQKMLVGELDEAREVAASLRQAKSEDIRRRAGLLEMNILAQEARAPGTDPRKREAARAALRTMVARMAQQGWDERTLQELATQAAHLQDPDLAAQLYRRLSTDGRGISHQWFAEAAKLALADGNYGLAAELYFTAQNRAPSRTLQRDYFIAGLKTLQSGNLLDQAMEAADQHVDGLADDPETLFFLTNLARAANDMPRAESYVKRLLRLSAVEAPPSLLAGLLDLLVPSAQAAEAEPALRPYDEKVYTLAYEVFLGNRNLKDAYRVAKAAVAARPDDMAWLERLAKVAEWGGKPEEALGYWKRLAERENLPEAWQGILRLAPGLNDQDALIAAWSHEARTRTLSDAEWDNLIDAYENRGDPDGAIALLRPAAVGNPGLMKRLADLSERADRLGDAVQAYGALERRGSADTATLVSYVTVLMAQDRLEDAFAVLQKHRDDVPKSQNEYWGLLGELAWMLQKDDAAEYAYRRLAESGKADVTVFERLISLLQERYPREALLLAEQGSARFGRPGLTITALELAWSLHDLSAMERIFRATPKTARPGLERMAYYWSLRAQFREARGERDKAMLDYRRAIALAPDDQSVLAAYLWLLVDMQDTEKLRIWLGRVDGRLGQDGELAKVAAAAFLTIGRPERALPLMEREARRQKDDYLWQLGYADALEQGGRNNQAWKVRYRVWRELRKQSAQALNDKRRLQLYVQLAQRFTPGDPSLAALRLLLRQDQGTTGEQPPEQKELEAQSRELALSWALSQERNEAAKAWLWRNYGRKLAAPRWAAVSLALADNDLDRLETLFEQGGGLGIPRYDRIEAAKRLGRLREAQSLAFDTLDAAPDDDRAQDIFTETILDSASSLQGEVRAFRRGVLTGVERTVSVGWWLSPVLKIEPSAIVIHQGSEDQTALPGVPAVDRKAGVGATYRTKAGEWTGSVASRTALDTFTELNAGFSARDQAGFQWSAALMRNGMAAETAALRVGGAKDQVEATLGYAFSRREYLRTRLWEAKYYSQWRDYLAKGHGLDWEVGHRFRIEYPDFSVRLAGSTQWFKRDGVGDQLLARLSPDGTAPPVETFLPENYQYYAVVFGYGDHYQDHYSRGLRSFATVGLGHNTLSGAAYDVNFGATTSVFGGDRFTFGYENATGGNGANENLWELWLRYEYFL